MLNGYIDLFMDPSLAECYVQLKEELDKLIQKKVVINFLWNYLIYTVCKHIYRERDRLL
jgi:hypothetical protein